MFIAIFSIFRASQAQAPMVSQPWAPRGSNPRNSCSFHDGNDINHKGDILIAINL